MPQSHARKWICRWCGWFVPRVEAEAMASRPEPPAEGATCPHCGTGDALYSHASPEGAELINGLTFEAYAAGLLAAGYEVVLYSPQCNHGNHEQCVGRNGLAATPPDGSGPGLAQVPDIHASLEKNRLPHHCFCPCHKKSSGTPSLPANAGRNFKAAWDSFIKLCLNPVFEAARAAGLTEVEARRVALEVVLRVANSIPWESIPDETKIQHLIQEMTLRRIAALRQDSQTPPANAPQAKQWWRFWK